MIGARLSLLVLLCIMFLSSFVVSEETGNLQIRCKPGIQIYLDDQIVGITTEKDDGLLVNGIVTGVHTVRGEDADFVLPEFAAGIKAGETTEIKIGNDGAPMVLIPAGEFQMGGNMEVMYKKYSNEKPIHPVYVDAFYMDEYEVTNALYKKFIDANPRWGKDRIEGRYYLKDWSGNEYPSGKADHPVVSVGWYAANAYAKWAGKRLPKRGRMGKGGAWRSER